jgi:hypothetical protein
MDRKPILPDFKKKKEFAGDPSFYQLGTVVRGCEYVYGPPGIQLSKTSGRASDRSQSRSVTVSERRTEPRSESI